MISIKNVLTIILDLDRFDRFVPTLFSTLLIFQIYFHKTITIGNN